MIARLRKVLKPELAALLGTERFVAEIRTTASLQHPHILPLFSVSLQPPFAATSPSESPLLSVADLRRKTCQAPLPSLNLRHLAAGLF